MTDTDADRQARRDAIRDLITRIGRGRAGPDVATLLASHLDAEQADGDQAREQLAAARAGDGKGRTASDVLVEHDVTRKALCDALDQGYHLNWQQLVDTAQRSHDANAAWQAEAEQHRKALCEALACFPSTRWGDLPSIAAERIEQRQRAEERAEAAEAGERRAMEQRQQMAEERFAWQERGDRAEISARAHKTAAAEALERAERAEATLTAVREAVADAAECRLWERDNRQPCGQDHLGRIEAALSDRQPATETAPEDGWAPATCRRMNTRTCPPTGPCPGPCARFESDDTTPWEQTAEPEAEEPAAPPTVSVIDALAADLIAAFRRAITTITKD